MPLDPNTAIILIDHGSQHDAANVLLEDICRQVQARVGAAVVVEPAHMELAPPTLQQAFDRCVARGARHIVVMPYFLAPGRHSTLDIPRMAEEAAAAHPGISYVVAQPLGSDPRMIELVLHRVDEAIGSVSSRR